MHSYTANSVMCQGVTTLSDWAVGNDVGPTAGEIKQMRATTVKPLLIRLLLPILALLTLYLNRTPLPPWRTS